ncbi:B12-binding domain-containing radical SAM protein [Thermosediminibacter oceani]|uniref:Radical SAM domain protein n=1 Tax=Thermosediminibacter oceani (strain ATCC BAA-1034 / DSM 16646 / JW/IW-1228P) TaxID=555079 RepID=D9S2V0_THEOJ|nr:B12-binding domain-containing radical SAM protein [Thermosediminibacter oceani]ADL07727.1 Radical SAM domain protein [Thermosediminibacter oceani DSM 16646]
MHWKMRQKIERLREEEIALLPIKSFGSVPVNVALVFPNIYELGMSNLGFQAIYREINTRQDSLCHRAFLFKGFPAHTIEAIQPLESYDIVAFSVSFELDYINLLKILHDANIPLFAQERVGPLVMMGGPAATFNPEPLSPFVDFVVIGEGEEVIHEIIDAYRDNKGSPKETILEKLAQIEGVYVPRLYDIGYNERGGVEKFEVKPPAPSKVRRRWIKNLDALNTETAVLTPNTEFKDMFLIEISRGCGRNCRFCMAGYCYRVPRVRALEKIIDRAEFASKYGKRVGLVGAAVSDYPRIDELSEELTKRGIKFSVSSLRADTLREPLLRGLSLSGHKTLTIAPEAGSQRLRNVINKGLTEDHVLDSINMAQKFGIKNIKLYYIIGLPTETSDDIEEMIDFLTRVKEKMVSSGNKTGLLTVSINPFIPKPFTPFQWFGMEPVPVLEEKLRKLKSSLKPKGIKVLYESPRVSQIQAALARGDRTTAMMLYKVHLEGGDLSRFRRVWVEGKNVEYYAHREFDLDVVLPWEHIDIGLKKEYFVEEYKRALKGESTRRCTEEVCNVCKICRK